MTNGRVSSGRRRDGRSVAVMEPACRRKSWRACVDLPRLLDQAVLHGVQRRARPGAEPDLGVDVLYVPLGGPRGYHQAGGDLLVRQARSEEPENLHLAVGEAG